LLGVTKIQGMRPPAYYRKVSIWVAAELTTPFSPGYAETTAPTTTLPTKKMANKDSSTRSAPRITKRYHSNPVGIAPSGKEGG
jgi:hypothetical protein